jgi:gluconate kinase
MAKQIRTPTAKFELRQKRANSIHIKNLEKIWRRRDLLQQKKENSLITYLRPTKNHIHDRISIKHAKLMQQYQLDIPT